MKFLLDAQLPRRLAVRLRELGHDAIHTLDLPRANQTTDLEISELSARESRVVVTKDSDFVDSLLLRGRPWKLLLVTTALPEKRCSRGRDQRSRGEDQRSRGKDQ